MIMVADLSQTGPDSLTEDVLMDSPARDLLKAEWMSGLATEIQSRVRFAQQCLIENGRTNAELADAMSRLKAWRKSFPEAGGQTPPLVRDENLGTQLDPAAFVRFLVAQKSAEGLKPYEWVALALLQEARGLADLEAVATKSTLGRVTQYLTLRVGRFYKAIVLLRLSDADPKLGVALNGILTSLFPSGIIIEGTRVGGA